MKKPLAWMAVGLIAMNAGAVNAGSAIGASGDYGARSGAGPAGGAPVSADKPRFELIARTSDRDGFELTEHSYFTHDPVALSDGGDVAVVLSALHAQLVGAIWVRPNPDTGAAPRIAYGQKGEYLLRYPRFTPTGGVLFEQINPEFESEGLYVWDRVSDETRLAVPSGGLMGIAYFGASQVLRDGHVAFLGKTAAGAQVLAIQSPEGRSALVAATVSIDQHAGYSYIFNPAINEHGQFAAKVRLGSAPKDLAESQPDQIRVWSRAGESVLVAQDRDADPASPFVGFDNGVSLSNGGVVAFAADLASGARGVFVWSAADGVRQVAATSDAGLAEIELFAPVVNDSGMVAFRGKNGDGLSALFMGEAAQGWRELLREGDALPSDLGIVRLAKGDPMSSSVFASGLAINSLGRVAFRCTTAYEPEGGQPIRSSSIYVLRR